MAYQAITLIASALMLYKKAVAEPLVHLHITSPVAAIICEIIEKNNLKYNGQNSEILLNAFICNSFIAIDCNGAVFNRADFIMGYNRYRMLFASIFHKAVFHFDAVELFEHGAGDDPQEKRRGGCVNQIKGKSLDIRG